MGNFIGILSSERWKIPFIKPKLMKVMAAIGLIANMIN